MDARITGIDPSGSSLDRIARCPASAALPQVFDAGPSAARDRGTAIHAFFERVGELGRETALAEVDEKWRPICEGVELATLPVKLSAEVAVAYNWKADTARRLQPLEPRLYEIDPNCEIPLTLDVVGVAERSVYVGDYKGPYAWLPEPEQSMQLGVGALAIARIHDASHARVEYMRVRDDGTVRRFDASLDVFALEAAAERVQRTMAIVGEAREAIAAGVTPNVTEGPWCRFCPARQHCPAKTALIRAAAAQPAPISLREPLTPATAGQVYVQLKRWKEAFAMVEGALYAYAKDTAIPVGVEEDGTEVWFGEFTR
ncbi:MAG TPA: PD-(D/E)XK nuclease family protein, partial [Myxococcota bacterium]|nr:PD-(D/E)XK nuclease family protein [Myxococcota bacterium]